MPSPRGTGDFVPQYSHASMSCSGSQVVFAPQFAQGKSTFWLGAGSVSAGRVSSGSEVTRGC